MIPLCKGWYPYHLMCLATVLNGKFVRKPLLHTLHGQLHLLAPPALAIASSLSISFLSLSFIRAGWVMGSDPVLPRLGIVVDGFWQYNTEYEDLIFYQTNCPSIRVLEKVLKNENDTECKWKIIVPDSDDRDYMINSAELLWSTGTVSKETSRTLITKWRRSANKIVWWAREQSYLYNSMHWDVILGVHSL